MKKLFYFLLVTVSLAMTFTSCTEEEVAPKTETDAGGGAGNDPMHKG